MSRNLAIIPARSGSKGLPNKNIMELCGKPLLVYSIDAALKSGQFETVMVSTDSENYAEIARRYGAEVPFLRSKSTSSDNSSSWDAVEEVLREYEKMGKRYDTFCLLQPTSPLRNAQDIINAYDLFDEKKAFAVIAMTELEHPIEWCGKIDETLELQGFLDRNANFQRQQMKKTYRPNGSIYIVSTAEFKTDRFLYREGSYAYIMPSDRSVDIDSESDFEYARFIMERQGF